MHTLYIHVDLLTTIQKWFAFIFWKLFIYGLPKLDYNPEFPGDILSKRSVY